jgi:hypothetical protein
VKFAAKRTWPDHPKSWERQGEAESLEAFALAFASDAGMGLGTEMMVVQKDSDDPAIELFRVTATEPYALGPAQPRPAGAPAAAASSQGALEAAAAGGGNPQAQFSYVPVAAVLWSMGRIAFIIGGVTAAFILAIKYVPMLF